MPNYMAPNTQETLTRFLGKGVPMRTIAYGLELDEKTVARHQRWIGKTCMALMAQQGGFTFEHMQADEFYTKVYAKKDNVEKLKRQVDFAGEILHFLGVESESGFVINYGLAPSNGVPETRPFLLDLDARLAKNPDGTHVVQPELITDGHGSYWSVIQNENPLSGWRYGRFNKLSTYTTKDGRVLKKRMFGGIRRENLTGNVTNPESFDTQEVEAVNGSARSLNMRVHKKSKAFSKRLAQHEEQFATWAWHYNRHWLSTRTKQTPAMLAGVDSTLWDARRLIRAMEEFREEWRELERVEAAEAKLLIPTEGPCAPDVARFWVYHSPKQRSVKVHMPGCCHCNHGAGKGGLLGANGSWLPFATFDAAMTYAQWQEPGRGSVCGQCIGEYRRLGRRL